MALEAIMMIEFEKWNSEQQNRRKEIIDLQELDEVTSAILIRDWERHDRVVFELSSAYSELSRYMPKVLNIGFEVARSRLLQSVTIAPETEPEVYGWALTLWQAIWKGTKIRVGELVSWRDKAVEIWKVRSSDIP
jgi:hypothetical protein